MGASMKQMSKPMTTQQADPVAVEAWVTGWALSRRTPAPTVLPHGFRVDVGLPREKARYVLPKFQPEIVAGLASRIVAPWTFIKVCAEPGAVVDVLPEAWTVQTPVFMMTAELAESENAQGGEVLPKGYAASVFDEGSIVRVLVTDASGTIAASGQCALDDAWCTYDQIVTDEQHRRRGLGRHIMKLLSRKAITRGKKQGVLVATADGLALYGTIGWKIHSPVTSAVIIPGEETAPS